MAAFVSCDGEASQIRVLMSEDVVARFKDVKLFWERLHGHVPV